MAHIPGNCVVNSRPVDVAHMMKRRNYQEDAFDNKANLPPTGGCLSGKPWWLCKDSLSDSAEVAQAEQFFQSDYALSLNTRCPAC